MADKTPEFKPDVVAALKLLINAMHAMASSMPQGAPRSLALASQMLEPPVPPPEEVEAETPDPTNRPIPESMVPAKVA